MIKHATFKNFKSLRDVDVDFERLTVIVGPNGSGKTSILEGIRYLSQFASWDQQVALEGVPAFDRLHNRNASSQVMEITASNAMAAFQWEVTLPENQLANRSPADLSSLIPLTSLGSGHALRCKALNQVGAIWRPVFGSPDRDPIVAMFRWFRLLRLDARKIQQSSHPGRSNLASEDGEGLASKLALMALRDPERFQSLQDHLRSLIPSVERIRFDRIRVTRQEFEEIRVDELKIPRRVSRIQEEDLI